jgi:adenylate cyclase
MQELLQKRRIWVSLKSFRSSAHIWAERLDRDMDNLFAMQDEVTERIVTTIANRLERTEEEWATRKGQNRPRCGRCT